MRQKYEISWQDEANELIIREYAIIDKDLRQTKNEMLHEDDYALLCQENYEGKAIETSIAKGIDAVISTLRTVNLFPIEPYAARIAESVMDLNRTGQDSSVELFFDDNELFVVL